MQALGQRHGLVGSDSRRATPLCSRRRAAVVTPVLASTQPSPSPPPRVATVVRQTKETSVSVTINLDGTGKCIAETPVGFLNHMLDQISSHGLFDLEVRAKV